jgi:FkbM family methyltransferase
MERNKYSGLIVDFKRLSLLFRESAWQDWPAIIWSLRPSARRRGEHLAKFLAKKGIIRDFRVEKKIGFLDYFFYYAADDLAALTADLVSIWGRDLPFFRDKFIGSGLYFFEGPYETDSVTVKDGDYVVDAGANLGLFSASASRKAGASGTVYAFEPIARTRELLEKNIAVNHLGNVRIESLALGSQNGPVSFNVGADLGSSSAVFSLSEVKGSEAETAMMQTLDYLVETERIVRVDFIKADIEGGERDLLQGARQVIRRFHPRLSLCTYHRPDDRQVLTAMLQEIEPKYKIAYSATKLFAHYDEAKIDCI